MYIAFQGTFHAEIAARRLSSRVNDTSDVKPASCRSNKVCSPRLISDCVSAKAARGAFVRLLQRLCMTLLHAQSFRDYTSHL